MITKSKIAFLAATLALVAGMTVTSTEAQARRWGLGIASGLVIGTAIAAPTYAYVYRRCKIVRQYDVNGFYIGRAKVCAY